VALSIFKTSCLNIVSKILCITALVSAGKALGATGVAQTVYIDMGMSYGYLESQPGLIDWNLSHPVFNESALNAVLNTFFTNLNNMGVTQINLSFAQLTDIDYYIGEISSPRDPYDVIAQILRDGYYISPDQGVTSTSPNLVAYMVEYAHNLAPITFTVGISFGGVNALTGDWTILAPTPPAPVPPGFPESGAGQGIKLVNWITDYNFDAVDFDIEGYFEEGGGYELFLINGQAVVLNFFETVHQQLSKLGIPCLGTFLGDLTAGPGNYIAPLCQSFVQYFDGVNLMLYGGKPLPYYIDWDNSDATGVNWGLNQWLYYVKNYTYLHVGFYDQIVYNLAEATIPPDPTPEVVSAGFQYIPAVVPEGLSVGDAAGAIYLYAIGSNGLGTNKTTMGTTFWWIDDPRPLYQSISGTPPSQYTTISDFFQYISTH